MTSPIHDLPPISDEGLARLLADLREADDAERDRRNLLHGLRNAALLSLPFWVVVVILLRRGGVL